MCSIFGCTDNKSNETSSESLAQSGKLETRAQQQTSSTSPESKTPGRDISKVVFAKKGCFRFVVARASNGHHLAISRLKLLAESDAETLLRLLFVKGAHEFFANHGSNVHLESFAMEHTDAFGELSSKMSIERETSSEFRNFYAAYRMATINHQDILASVQLLVDSIGDQYDLGKNERRELSQSIMLQYSVGWAGNKNDVVVRGYAESN